MQQIFIKGGLLSVLQLMGSFVLAVGLWLRFDPETVSLLNGEKAPDTFFIGEYHTHVNCCLDATLHLLTENADKKSKSPPGSWRPAHSRDMSVNNRKLHLHSINA